MMHPQKVMLPEAKFVRDVRTVTKWRAYWEIVAASGETIALASRDLSRSRYIISGDSTP